jgi:hypothetical protein
LQQARRQSNHFIWRNFYFALIAFNANHASKQFRRIDRGIAIPLAVASSYEAQFFVNAFRNEHFFSFHHAMHKKSPFPQEYGDFARQNFLERGALNQNHVTRQNRRDHAGSKNSEANLAEIANNFSRKSAR